jgi:predicted DCC family thiol-disulfide oxidoreductase YuxK
MDTQPIILFDGVCNYCNSLINWLIKADKKKVYRFATIQSEAGQALLKTYGLEEAAVNSFIMIRGGKAYQKSTAALKVMDGLPWYWKEVQVLRVVPRFLRDEIYDFIARNRYKWFGKRDTCMMPTPELRDRFLG